jgi:hypothetical protein
MHDSEGLAPSCTLLQLQGMQCEEPMGRLATAGQWGTRKLLDSDSGRSWALTQLV